VEIFNIHIFELVMIAALGLIVFGPERLPEVGRFLGKQVARVLAWQQNSPEAQMITEIRSEFEREIVNLRDELSRTRKELDISADVQKLRDDTKALFDSTKDAVKDASKPAAAKAELVAAPEPTTVPQAESVSAAELAPVEQPQAAIEAVAEHITPDAESLVEVAEQVTALDPPEVPTLKPTPAADTVPSAVRPNRRAVATENPVQTLNALNGKAESTPAAVDTAVVLQQVEQLRKELQSLLAELRARGVITDPWANPEPLPDDPRPAEHSQA
jgi:sec-independent protein translocase protein TatB